MPFQVLNNRIAIRPLRDPDVTSGGIIIPSMAKERVDQGIIKFIGPSVEDESLTIGKHVLFSAYDGTLILDEEEGELIIMPETAIKAILNISDVFVPGVYLKSTDGEYFETTYHALIEFAAMAMRESGVLHSIDTRGRNKAEHERRLYGKKDE
jgi:chaperonin GroES